MATELTMRCDLVLERLSAHLDGELPAAEATVVRAHLSACGSCAEAYARLERLERLAAKALAPAAPPLGAAEWQACWQRVRAGAKIGGAAVPALAAREPERRPAGTGSAERSRILRLGAWVSGVGALAASALVAVALLRGPDASSRPPLPPAPDASVGPLLAFDGGAGANACEVLTVSAAAGYTPTIVYPASDADPVVIWFTRANGS